MGSFSVFVVQVYADYLPPPPISYNDCSTICIDNPSFSKICAARYIVNQVQFYSFSNICQLKNYNCANKGSRK